MVEAKSLLTVDHVEHLLAAAGPVQEVAAIAVAGHWQATVVERWRRQGAPYGGGEEEAVVAGTRVDRAGMAIGVHAAELPVVTVHPEAVAVGLVSLSGTLGVPAVREGPLGHPVDMRRVLAVGRMVLVEGHGHEGELELVVSADVVQEVADSMIGKDAVAAVVGTAQYWAAVAVEPLGELDKEAPT